MSFRKTHPIIDLFKVGCRELAFVKPTLNKYIKAIGFIKNVCSYYFSQSFILTNKNFYHSIFRATH